PPLETILSGKTIHFKFEPFNYQYEGIAFLYPRQFGVLADEMGLGKTMQAISSIRLLLHAREINEVLLVCPKPLATNWIREFETWAPEIPIEIIGGDQAKRNLQWANQQIPVKVANYELILRDIQLIKAANKHFDLVVLDEAQRIKNPRSSTSQSIKSLPRSRNWALTGTPIENSVDDLAGIFDFLSEGLVRPGMSPRKMAGEVKNYILRRTKDEVLDDMPPKIINDVYLQLNENQQQAYDLAEQEGIIRLNKLGAELSVQHVFELVLRLKQICNSDPLSSDSTKTERLEADLEEVVASGQKAIVFSQWVGTLKEISGKLTRFRPLEYHGKIPANRRDAVLEEFKNSQDRPVILMSYGTGSVGLNLQFCRYVFLYDRWWNPAVEDQAINRAHRLVSAGSVTVNRMI
ncbi:MAG: DEAD/DEAH box helicase, partial [Planctomycetota bacterium]|nr:DEAD/DEAH box helicase [Planctomycetota bacterium]